MAFLSLSYIAVEYVEHIGSPHTFNLVFHIEFWHYTLFVPLVGGIFLSILARTEDERERAVRQLNLKHELSVQLSTIENWDELCDYLVDYPRHIAPFCEISLFLYDQVIDEFQFARGWAASTDAAHTRKPWPKAIDAATLVRVGTLHPLAPELSEDLERGDECPAFSLPLKHGELLVASYILRIPVQSPLLIEDRELLESVAPSIALALNALHPQGSRLVQAQAISAEQRRLSRYLHDTVSQDLAFMLKKLEELQQEETLHDPAAVQKGLAKMQEVANQAYISARDLMGSLHPFDSTDLATTLYRQARLEFGRESEIEIETTSSGQERPIPPETERKILGIFRETLVNVRKHANARRFEVHLQWESDCLTMILRDDGDGFDVASMPKGGHYGLAIMCERAEEIAGHITLESGHGSGTTVNLTVPIRELSEKPAGEGVDDAVAVG